MSTVGVIAMLQTREYFIKEEMAKHMRILHSLHEEGGCTGDSCPHCLYEAQFESDADRKAWEEYEFRQLFRSHYGG